MYNIKRPTSMKNLIVLCAGDTSLHQSTHGNWIQPLRTYDVAIIYYGQHTDIQQQYTNESDYFYTQRGPKWTLIRDFLSSQSHIWQKYDFVAFPDDDLEISVPQWNTLFEYGHTYRLDLYQPSLVDNGPEYIKHTLLVSQPQNQLRYVNFVEVMTPIFSQRALKQSVQKNILVDKHLQSGWGVDYVLPQTILPHHKYDYPPLHHKNKNTYQVAVIDAVPIVHTKPLSNTTHAKQSSFYKTFNIDPEKEMHYFMKTYHTKPFTPSTLRYVPVPATDVSTLPTCTPTSTNSPNITQRVRRSRPLKRELPLYLLNNVKTEFNLVKSKLHPSYSTSKDIENFHHKITFGFHARIRKNVLHVVKDFGSFESRNKNTIAMLCDVLCRYTIDDIDILVNTDDFVRHPDIHGVPILCMAKKLSQTYITYPDHSFYKWTEAHTRSWDEERTQLMRTTFPRPRPQALFRGNLTTFYLREYLAKASQKERQYTQYPKKKKPTPHQKKNTKKNNRANVFAPVLDVVGVNVGVSLSLQSRKKKKIKQKKSFINTQICSSSTTHTSVSPSFVPLHEHAKWKYLLHIPGRSYAARLKYLLASNSVVLYVKKNDAYEYKEFWYNYLEDNKNCIVIHDNNVYDAHNQNIVKRSKQGKKIWDDRNNELVVNQIRKTVRILEDQPQQTRSIIHANEEWRNTFDYEMVLKYFGVVLNEIARLDGALNEKN